MAASADLELSESTPDQRRSTDAICSPGSVDAPRSQSQLPGEQAETAAQSIKESSPVHSRSTAAKDPKEVISRAQPGYIDHSAALIMDNSTLQPTDELRGLILQLTSLQSSLEDTGKELDSLDSRTVTPRPGAAGDANEEAKFDEGVEPRQEGPLIAGRALALHDADYASDGSMQAGWKEDPPEEPCGNSMQEGQANEKSQPCDTKADFHLEQSPQPAGVVTVGIEQTTKDDIQTMQEQLLQSETKVLELQDSLEALSNDLDATKTDSVAKDELLEGLIRQLRRSSEREDQSALEMEALRQELKASEETVVSMQADLEAERQLTYNQSAAHSLALELAEEHLYGQVRVLSVSAMASLTKANDAIWE